MLKTVMTNKVFCVTQYLKQISAMSTKMTELLQNRKVVR